LTYAFRDPPTVRSRRTIPPTGNRIELEGRAARTSLGTAVSGGRVRRKGPEHLCRLVVVSVRNRRDQSVRRGSRFWGRPPVRLLVSAGRVGVERLGNQELGLDVTPPPHGYREAGRRRLLVLLGRASSAAGGLGLGASRTGASVRGAFGVLVAISRSFRWAGGSGRGGKTVPGTTNRAGDRRDGPGEDRADRLFAGSPGHEPRARAAPRGEAAAAGWRRGAMGAREQRAAKDEKGGGDGDSSSPGALPGRTRAPIGPGVFHRFHEMMPPILLFEISLFRSSHGHPHVRRKIPQPGSDRVWLILHPVVGGCRFGALGPEPAFL